MEDQQPDSGDLTADAAATPTGRRRHRMPPAKKRAPAQVDPEPAEAAAEVEAVESAEAVDEKTDTVSEPTSEATELEESAATDLGDEPAAGPDATPTAAKTAGRWRFWRRKGSDTQGDTAAPEPSTDSVEDSVGATAAADAVASRPVGKRRRAATAVAAPAAAEPVETSDAPEPATVEAPKTETDVVDAAVVEPDADESLTGEAASETDESASEADESASETDETAEAAPVLVPQRPAGKKLKIAAVAAAALFVAGGAFAGAAVQPYLADRALVETKTNIAETAAAAINTLWTYTPDDMAALPNRASQYLAGNFATEYQRYIDAIVSTNKQAQVSNNTQVMGTAVESVTPNEATALVYTNSVSTSPVTKNIPSLRYLSYRLIMQREDTRWLITKMTAITQLDLTPRL